MTRTKHFVLLLNSILIAGCVDAQSRKAIVIPSDSETLDHSTLGAHYCLLAPGVNPVPSARAQIREITGGSWEAHEQSSSAAAGFSHCDIAFSVLSGVGPCAGSNPALNTLLPGGHLSIVPGTLANTYDVTFKSPKGVPYKELGSNGKVTMQAARGTTVGGVTYTKWLAEKDVPWAGYSDSYDIYLYMIDTPGSAKMPETYRFEFFKSGVSSCSIEEPDNPSTVSGPFDETQANCQVQAPGTRKPMQEPVGDGHHPKPNLSGGLPATCP